MPPFVYLLCALGIILFVLHRLFPKQPTTEQAEAPPQAKAEPYRSKFGTWTCEHGPFSGRKSMTIKGKQIGIDNSMFCDDCTQKYFEKYATLCDKCGDVICPCMPVGQHWGKDKDGNDKLLTVCQKSSCSIPGDICGHWGEGRIMPMPWGDSKVRERPTPAPEPTPEPVAVAEPPEQTEPPVQAA